MKGGYIQRPRKRYCGFCRQKMKHIDYKNIELLRKYVSDKGKIKPRRVTGTCTQHQKALAVAVKRAREIALLPYLRRIVKVSK